MKQELPITADWLPAIKDTEANINKNPLTLEQLGNIVGITQAQIDRWLTLAPMVPLIIIPPAGYKNC